MSKQLVIQKLCKKIFCFPGNAGTMKLANNINIDISNFKTLLKFIKFYEIDLVIIGPEEPLVLGLVDFLQKNRIKVFGPNRFASKLEGSKAFVKKFVNLTKFQQQDLKFARKKRCFKIFKKMICLV